MLTEKKKKKVEKSYFHYPQEAAILIINSISKETSERLRFVFLLPCFGFFLNLVYYK